jgi:hypothetical protein
VKVCLGFALVCLSACSWFGSTHAAPDPSAIIVNGAPAGSVVFIDAVQAAPPAVAGDRPQIVRVRAGDHKVEIHEDDKIVYREDTYVGRGETRAVTVLSGSHTG